MCDSHWHKHRKVHLTINFKDTMPNSSCFPFLKSAKLTELINDVEVIFHLEPVSVSYEVVVKCLLLFHRWTYLFETYNINMFHMYCTVSSANTIKNRVFRKNVMNIFHEFSEQPSYNWHIDRFPSPASWRTCFVGPIVCIFLSTQYLQTFTNSI